MVPRVPVQVSDKTRVEKPPWGLAFGKPVAGKGWEWQNQGKDFSPVHSAFGAGRGRGESHRAGGLQELGGLRARCEAFRSCVAEGRLLSFVFNCRCYQRKVRRLTGPVPLIFHLFPKEGIGLSSSLLQRLRQRRAARSSPRSSGRAARRGAGSPGRAEVFGGPGVPTSGRGGAGRAVKGRCGGGAGAVRGGVGDVRSGEGRRRFKMSGQEGSG